jgi:hypothetical protein
LDGVSDPRRPATGKGRQPGADHSERRPMMAEVKKLYVLPIIDSEYELSKGPLAGHKFKYVTRRGVLAADPIEMSRSIANNDQKFGEPEPLARHVVAVTPRNHIVVGTGDGEFMVVGWAKLIDLDAVAATSLRNP